MISVCMATFNGHKYIKLQIDSILRQLSVGDELIISDHGSIDGTIKIIEQYNDPRIKLIKNLPLITSERKHILVASNFNAALREANGNYIFLADQDDVWLDCRVSKCLALLEEYSLVMCNCKLINSEGEFFGKMNWQENPISKYFFMNLINMPFHGCSMAFSSKVLNLCVPFPKGLVSHDNWIGLLATRLGKVVYLDEPLVAYRRHSNNVSSRGVSANTLFFKIYYRMSMFYQILKRLLNEV
jgi:glycosyltransferase involved in cell wall biosynthesis